MSKNILYSNVTSLPNITGSFFQRQRVENLLKKSLEFPLITITAGAGYGKTQAVSAFLHNADFSFIWLQLSELDNLTTRFWESFVYAVASQNPCVAERLIPSGFPHSEAQFDDFLHRLANAVSETGKIVLVFDDFHLIEEPNITRFFENLLNARIKLFSVILLSRIKININIPGMITNKLLLQITEEDLRFSPEETGDYYRTLGIVITDLDLQNIYSKTEGWIFAIYLIGLSLKRSCFLSESVMAAAKNQIFSLIDAEIFSEYSDEVRNILIELSVLGDFSIELLKELVDLNILIDISKTNTFIYFNPVTKCYRFHNLFSEYLSDKLVYLDNEKIKNTYLKIADWYLGNNFKVDALVYYEKCEKYETICDILSAYKVDLPVEEANLFLGMIERIPADIIEKRPILNVIHARLLLNNGKVAECCNELSQIIKKYNALPPTAENKAILGEAYIFEAMISLLTKNFEFPKLFKLADESLPDGSKLVDNRLFVTNGNSSIAIEKPVHGEMKRFEDAMAYAVPYASRVMRGCCYGADFLTKTEAAYYTGDMHRAESSAFKAIYRAGQKGQNDIVCCAYFFLIRISFASGDFIKASNFLNEFSKKLDDCISITDIFKGWYFVKIGDTSKIADWIKSEERSSRIISPNSSCNDWFVRAYFLLKNENFHELLAYVEYLNDLHEKKGFLLTRIEAKILLSIAALKVKDFKLSVSALQQAYELSYANKIIMHFAEQGSNMRSVIDNAKKLGGHSIPKEWLNNISAKANTYAKKLNSIIAKYNESEGINLKKPYNLTTREKEILRCLCQGLSRDEIAGSLYISTNTVKSSLQNIYNKLGAENRTVAVKIAISSGLDQ